MAGENYRRAVSLGTELKKDLGGMVGGVANDLCTALVYESPIKKGWLKGNYTVVTGSRTIKAIEDTAAAYSRQRASKRRATKYKLGKRLAVVNPLIYAPIVAKRNNFVDRAIRRVQYARRIR